MFGIECQRSEENVNFYFDDPEAARYVWKLAVLQVLFEFESFSPKWAMLILYLIFLIAHLLQANFIDPAVSTFAGN